MCANLCLYRLSCSFCSCCILHFHCPQPALRKFLFFKLSNVHDSTDPYWSNLTELMWNWQHHCVHSHFKVMAIFIWKVIDSSDVIIQVLDARDPMGTRSQTIESYLKKEKPWKHLIFVLNKCDLIPTWVTVWYLLFPPWLGVYFLYFSVLWLTLSPFSHQKRWVAVLSQEYPTLAFHASLTNSFGKGSLIQLLRQFGKVSTKKKPKHLPWSSATETSNNQSILFIGPLKGI